MNIKPIDQLFVDPFLYWEKKMVKNESLCIVPETIGISITEICLQFWPTLQCTYGCGRNTIGYLA